MSGDQGDAPERPEFKPLTGADVDKFLDWCKGTEYWNDANIANVDVLDAFGGFSIGDLKWICQAIIQAKEIPDVSIMARAILARDVAILRPSIRRSESLTLRLRRPGSSPVDS
jgi:hypothetical protein